MYMGIKQLSVQMGKKAAPGVKKKFLFSQNFHENTPFFPDFSKSAREKVGKKTGFPKVGVGKETASLARILTSGGMNKLYRYIVTCTSK